MLLSHVAAESTRAARDRANDGAAAFEPFGRNRPCVIGQEVQLCRVYPERGGRNLGRADEVCAATEPPTDGATAVRVEGCAVTLNRARWIEVPFRDKERTAQAGCLLALLTWD